MWKVAKYTLTYIACYMDTVIYEVGVIPSPEKKYISEQVKLSVTGDCHHRGLYRWSQ